MKPIILSLGFFLVFMPFIIKNVNAQSACGGDDSTCPDWTESATNIIVGGNITFTLNAAPTCDPVTMTPPGSDIPSSNPSDYVWCFEGGVPGSPQGIGPQVINYPTCGTFSVSIDMAYCNGILCAFDYIRAKSSWITVTGCLPITLTSFTAKSGSNSNVLIEWTTSSEINNDYFIVERDLGLGSGDWETIGTVKGAGNSNTINNYQFADNQLPITDYRFYYRLKQIDYDGKFTYSKTISITTNNGNNTIGIPSGQAVCVYPNPVKDNLNYQFFSNMVARNIIITDVLGNVLMSEELKSKRGVIDVSLLLQGMYFINIDSTVRKFIKQ